MMATPEEIRQSIARVQEMEVLFDQLQQAYDTMSVALLATPEQQARLRTLKDYYFHGEWMADYALDEAGAIPKDLKRGVLSEDGLYHLLCDVMDALDEQ